MQHDSKREDDASWCTLWCTEYSHSVYACCGILQKYDFRAKENDIDREDHHGSGQHQAGQVGGPFSRGLW